MTPPIAAALETAIATFAPRASAAPREAMPRIPQHIAGVLDAQGARALPALVDGAVQQSIRYLTVDVGACSAETAAWVAHAGETLCERGVSFQALTNLAPSEHDAALLRAIRALPAVAAPRLSVTLAAAYDTKQDLADAARRVEKSGGACGAQDLQRHMAAGELPPVDLFLYANGSARLSSFLLWHAAYAELCFLPLAWSAFGAGGMRAAAGEFAARNRTFGALKK